MPATRSSRAGGEARQGHRVTLPVRNLARDHGDSPVGLELDGRLLLGPLEAQGLPVVGRPGRRLDVRGDADAEQPAVVAGTARNAS